MEQTSLAVRSLIDGQWTDASSELFERRNPASGAVVSTVRFATPADVDTALAAAARAQADADLPPAVDALVEGSMDSTGQRCTSSERLLVHEDIADGLSASVFTNDYSLVERAAAELDAGTVHINSASIGADPHVPFGGTGDSGFGPREQGTAARDFYTQSKTIYQKWVPAHA